MPLLRGVWSTDRSLGLLVLSLALLIFVGEPLQQVGVAGRLLITLFFSFLLISGVGAVAKSGRTTAVVGGLVLTSLAVRWLRLWLGGGSLVVSDALFSSLFCTVLAAVVLAQVLREGPITFYRIEGAVAFYLLLGLAWAFAYELVELHWPNAFAPPSPATTNPNDDPTARFVYFSFVTLTTVGYGDITAVHPFARSLVTLEALIGQLFPAILLARLVSLELYHRQAKDREHR
jgi:hypothetical protein